MSLIEVLAYITLSATKDVWCLITELKTRGGFHPFNLDSQLILILITRYKDKVTFKTSSFSSAFILESGN